MGIKTVSQPSYSQDLAPCDFCLFPKLRGCRYETIEEMKEAVTNTVTDTRGLPWGLPEVIGTVQQVHCSWRRLLRRGLEFHVYTINKSAHTKKVWKLIVCTSYIYIYIYIYICLLLNKNKLGQRLFLANDALQPRTTCCMLLGEEMGTTKKHSLPSEIILDGSHNDQKCYESGDGYSQRTFIALRDYTAWYPQSVKWLWEDMGIVK